MASRNLFNIDNLSLIDVDENSELIPLMTPEDEKEINNEVLPDSLPILPLRNTVLFPGVVIPITASRDKSIKLINDANAGISSPASDPRALASSVLQMISKSSFERDEMGRQGREYIKKQFDRNLLISKLEDFFSEAISLYKGKNVK